MGRAATHLRRQHSTSYTSSHPKWYSSNWSKKGAARQVVVKHFFFTIESLFVFLVAFFQNDIFPPSTLFSVVCVHVGTDTENMLSFTFSLFWVENSGSHHFLKRMQRIIITGFSLKAIEFEL
jgi:hypothetical protein